MHLLKIVFICTVASWFDNTKDVRANIDPPPQRAPSDPLLKGVAAGSMNDVKRRKWIGELLPCH